MSFKFHMTLLFILLILTSNVTWAMNTPNTSANALFLYRNSNFHQQDADPVNLDQDRNGINIQEAELQFFSDVDPYTRLNLLLTIHPEYEKDVNGRRTTVTLQNVALQGPQHLLLVMISLLPG